MKGTKGEQVESLGINKAIVEFLVYQIQHETDHREYTSVLRVE